MSDTRNDIKSISISVTARTKEAADKLTALNAILEQLKTTGKSISLPSKSITQFANALEKMSTVNLNGLSRKLVAISNAFQKMNFKGIDAEALRAQAALMNAQAKKDNIAVQKAKIAQSRARLAVAQQNAATSAAKQQRLASQAAAQGSRTRTSKAGAANGNQAAQGGDSWLKSWQQKWGLNGKFQVVSDLEKAAAAQKEYAKLVEANDKEGQKALEQQAQLIQQFSKIVVTSFAKAGAAVAKFSALVGKELMHSFTFAARSALRLTAAIGLAPWKRLARSVKDAVAGLSGFLSAVKRIAVYRAIRWALKQITQSFKEGMDNLYQYSLLINGTFKDSMDMLATSALYVKNSLAAMAAPIVNELAPAIDYLADKFVDLLNTVNETIAAMTGAETWTKAIKYPTEYAEAADDAAGSAKKLRNTLLGFDEINRLDDKSKSKRGSSGTLLDYSKMFEEKQVTKNAKSFVKTLKDAFKSGDLTSIGESLGKNLLDGLSKIPWAEIKTTITRNAKSVATLINGCINVPDRGYTLGKSIASAFNVAVAKMNEFFTTVEWGKIGDFLANGINGIIETFSIEDLARSFAARINGIASLLSNFASTLSWSGIASFLVSGITTAIEEIKIGDLTGAIALLFKDAIDTIGNVAETVDWKKLGAWLASGINSIFDAFNTDPPIAESIAKVFNAAITTIGSYVNNVKWDEIGTFLGENVNAFLQTFEIEDLGKTIAGVINKGWTLIGNFVDEVEWKDIGTFLSKGINGFLNETNTEKIGETISDAIVGILVAAKNFFKETDFQKIGEKIGELLKKINWTEILQGVVSVMIDALGSAFDILKGIWEKSPAAALVLGTALANLITTAVGLPSVVSMISSAIARIVGGAAAGAAAGGAAAGAAGGAAAGAAGSAAGAVAAGAAAGSVPGMVTAGGAAGGLLAGLAPLALLTGALFAANEVSGGESTRLLTQKTGLEELFYGTKSYTGNPDVKFPTKGYEKAVEAYNESVKALEKSLTALEKAIRDNTAKEADVNDWFDTKKGKTVITNLSNIDTASVSHKELFAAYKKKMEGSWIFKSGESTPTSSVKGSLSNSINKVLGRAEGGDVPTGSLFLAGEAGAEIVSSQGGRTTVHNRDQIAESVAIGNEEGNALLRQLVSVGNKLLAKDTSVVTQITTGDITSAMDRQNRREGRTVVPVALGG